MICRGDVEVGGPLDGCKLEHRRGDGAAVIRSCLLLLCRAGFGSHPCQAS